MSERPLLSTARQICAEDPDCHDAIDAVRTLTLIAFASALGRIPQLQRSLCLKGGTLLRILNHGQIGRLPSMDLDASILNEDFSPDLVETVVVDELGQLLRQRFHGELSVDVRYQRPLDAAQLRPGDSVLHIFRLSASAAINPSQPQKRSRIDAAKFCFEATEDEWIDRSLLTTLNDRYYGFPLNLCAYAPLQSMAEKLRALLQKLAYYERGIQQGGKSADDPGLLGNFIGRHVVDLEILQRLAMPYNPQELRRVFHAKCDAKHNLPFADRTAERLQHPHLVQTVRREYPQRAESALKLLAELAVMVTAGES